MRSKRGIFLSQRKYVLNLLFEIGKLRAKSYSSPMTTSVHLTRDEDVFEDLERYIRLIGMLNNFTVSRPNSAHSVSVVSWFMSSPTVDHQVAIEHILCYLKEALAQGILYYGHDRIECFRDVNQAGSKEFRRSILGILCSFEASQLLRRVRNRGWCLILSHFKLNFKIFFYLALVPCGERKLTLCIEVN